MILVRGKPATVACTSGQVCPGGNASCREEIECTASPSRSSLDTQFGDDGHGASRESLTPRLLGRVPAQEKSAMRIKPAKRNRSVELRTRGYSFFGSPCLSKNLSAIVPCVAAAPARSAAAISDASTTSSRDAPAACAALACASMQYGHCVVADTAMAISSRYFLGIAPFSRPTILFSPSHALKSSGASLRISRINLTSLSS